MFIERAKLQELEENHGARFVDGLIAVSDGWDPYKGIWIKEERYFAAIKNPADIARKAHPKWTHSERRPPITASVKTVTRDLKRSPLEKARLRLFTMRIYSPGLAEINQKICNECPHSEYDANKQLTRCRACGCGGNSIVRHMGAVEKPPMDSPTDAIPSNYSSSSPTKCFHNKWATLYFKNVFSQVIF
jgi:hypothetical protein